MTQEIPSPRGFLLSVPMYEEIAYTGEQVWKVIDVLYFAGTYDCFCTQCGRDATFQAVTPTRPDEYVRNLTREQALRGMGASVELPSIQPDVYRVVGQCTRDRSHLQALLFLVVRRVTLDESKKPYYESSVQKIGQHPSFGDLNLPRFKKYGTVLDKSLLGELNRAVGLASHDVGVGAYVYLRRVFEALIEGAHKAAQAHSDWDETKYQQSRMSERIQLLKDHLPIFLVEHPELYSLLSKGIHELAEAECLQHFDTLRIGIELILDEKLERKERERKIQEAEAALSKAVNASKA